MHRVLAKLPHIALVATTAVLIVAAVMLRDTSAQRDDRQARQAFAAEVQAGTRPDVQVRNIGGVLRQELASIDERAARDARVASWLAAVAALGVVGLIAGMYSTRFAARQVDA